jgi:hypothetical protein
MSKSVLARADALMQRRRQSGTESDDVPVLVDAIDPDMDIPVLVDAEPPAAIGESLPEPEPAAVPESGPALDDEMLDSIVRELARRVHERLAAELPLIVADTIRDLLAEPETLARFRPRD